MPAGHAAQAALARGAKLPEWNGAGHSYAAFKKNFTLYAIATGTAGYFEHIVTETSCAQGADDEVKLQAYAMLCGTIDSSLFDEVAVGVEQNKPNLFGDGDPLFKYDPNRLWKALEHYSKGVVPELAGEALSEQIAAWTFATTGSMEDRAAKSIRTITALQQQNATLGDADWPFTVKQAVNKVLQGMPARFKLDHSEFKGCTTLPALGLALQVAAIRYKKDGTSDLANTFAAFMTGGGTNPPHLSAAMEQQLAAGNMTHVAMSALAPFARPGRHMEESAGPPDQSGSWFFCKLHGWNHTHATVKCYHLEDDGSEREVFYKNKDGKYVLIKKPRRKKAAFNYFDIFSLNAILSSFDRTNFIDSCAEFSVANRYQFERMKDVRELAPHEQFSFEGSNEGGPTLQTHFGLRPIWTGSEYCYEGAYYGSGNKYNLTSTDVLAQIGTSTLVDANHPDRQLFLISARTGVTTAAKKIGNVWCLPTDPMRGTNLAADGPVDHLTMASTATAPPPPPTTAPAKLPIAPAAQGTQRPGVSGGATAADADRHDSAKAAARSSVVQETFDYELLRSTTGGTHAQTLQLAKLSNFKLSNVNRGRANIEDADDQANQRLRPLIPVQPLFRTERESVHTADTVGGLQPMSKNGKCYMMTWSKLGCNKYYVTFSDNHSAAATWLQFQEYARQSGLIVPRHSINSGLEVRTDAGTEFTGRDFTEPAEQAGIIASTATVGRSGGGAQSIAESNNARVQQGMRRNMVRAAENFAALGHNVDDYWDDAAATAALQDRTRLSIMEIGADAAPGVRAALMRKLGGPWGALASVWIHPKKRTGGKQMQRRAMNAVFLRAEDYKFKMLLEDGSKIYTTEVKFKKNLVIGASGHVDDDANESNDLWADADFVADKSTGATVAGVAPVYNVGDDVIVTWDSEGKDFVGRVTALDDFDGVGALHVTYPDTPEDDHWIPITGADKWTVVPATPTALSFATRRGAHTPHPSVCACLDADGNVLGKYLKGTSQLPPAPQLPQMHRDAQPPLPTSFAEAMASPHAIFWLHALLAEYHGHVSPRKHRPTWEYNTQRRFNGTRRMFAKLVYSYKFDGYRLSRFKIRIVMAGFGLVRGTDYTESYVGAPPISNLRGLEAVAIMLGLRVAEMDLKMAYTCATMPAVPNTDEPVQMTPCAGIKTFDVLTGVLELLDLLQALYGHPAAGAGLAQELHAAFTGQTTPTCSVPLVQSAAQPCVFKAVYPANHEFHGEIFWVWLFNDNIRTYYSHPKIHEDFRVWLAGRYEITGGDDLRHQDPSQCLGIQFTYTPGQVTLNMPAYVQQLIAEHGMADANPTTTPLPCEFLSQHTVPDTDEECEIVRLWFNKNFSRTDATYADTVTFYRSIAGAIAWPAIQCAPALALTSSLQGRNLHAPSIPAGQGIKKSVRFLCGHVEIGVTYKQTRTYNWRAGEFPEFEFFSDASLGDDNATRRSQGGYVGRFIGQAPHVWRSGGSNKVRLSTTTAELDWAAEAGREIEYERMFWQFLGFPVNKPTKLYCDNAAAVMHVQSPIRKFSPRTKSLDMKTKYIVELVHHNVLEIIHVPGVDNPADMMTKPSALAMVEKFHPILHHANQGVTGGAV